MSVCCLQISQLWAQKVPSWAAHYIFAPLDGAGPTAMVKPPFLWTILPSILGLINSMFIINMTTVVFSVSSNIEAEQCCYIIRDEK